MATQTKTGKAFEFALLQEFYEKLKLMTQVAVHENEPYFTAKNSFESFKASEQEKYKITASSAINFLIDIEPRLKNSISEKDILELEIVGDQAGQSGDVRDVLTLRALQKWEIGISAKNNHKAVKHSRLSNNIDFGKKWLDIPCSDEYFNQINPIFSWLKQIKDKDRNTLWTSIDNMHDKVYVPILNAFRNELMRLEKENSSAVASRLVQYLIGSYDFYKVIKGQNQVEVQGFNMHGTLNQSFKKEKPKAKIPKLKLPTRLIEIVYQNNSKTTLLVTMNEGWQISFRIHSASSRVEPSLKFDINLVSAPGSLFKTHKFIYE